MKYIPLPSSFYKENRAKFVSQMKPNTMAIFHSNDQYMRNGDCNFQFRQSSDMLWLSGIDQEQSILILYPDCPKGEKFREVLFTIETNDHIRTWEGYKLTQEQASELSGIQNCMWTGGMAALLNEMVLLSDGVYLNSNENDRAAFDVPSRDERKAREFRKRYPAHTVYRASPILKKLRSLKGQPEVETLSRAINITDKAFNRVMKAMKPGMMEYEIEAEISYEFLRNGASGHAYYPIIAGGGNACILHYNDNDRQLKDGDLILMDFGAEYANYAADLTRVVPVNGRFTARQKQVYNAVLRVHRAATKLLVPGNSIELVNKEVGRLIEGELVDLGLLSRADIDKQTAKEREERPLYKKYFPHGNSHHLGLDVHDLMLRYDTFQPGVVLTNEPGIYIPEEGIGIRIENDILVTASGNIDLMAHIPIEADEIEEIMNSK